MVAIHDLTLPILPVRWYHLYNRGIDRKYIFFNDGNRQYFLQKYAEKTHRNYRTFAYCLMDNHFHLMVQPIDAEDIISQAKVDFDVDNQTFLKDYVLLWLSRLSHQTSLMMMSQLEDLTNFKKLLNLFEQHGDIQQNDAPNPPNLSTSSFSDQLCSWILSERLRGFMLGYAKAINKQQQRTGSLFQKGFRRKFIPDDIEQKKQVLFYIYHNPIHHFFSDTYDDYVWNSYITVKSNLPTKLDCETVIHWFGTVENFISYGTQYITHKNSFNWIIDED